MQLHLPKLLAISLFITSPLGLFANEPDIKTTTSREIDSDEMEFETIIDHPRQVNSGVIYPIGGVGAGGPLRALLGW